jgi:hypothetical protein
MSTHESHPGAHELQEDDREIIRQIADLYGCSEEEAEEMWLVDFAGLKSKADRPKRRISRHRPARKR